MQPADSKIALRDIVHHFTLFALHPSKPYAVLFVELSPPGCQLDRVGLGWGNGKFLSELQKLYAPDYPGPFTVGVWWQEADSKRC